MSRRYCNASLRRRSIPRARGGHGRRQHGNKPGRDTQCNAGIFYNRGNYNRATHLHGGARRCGSLGAAGLDAEDRGASDGRLGRRGGRGELDAGEGGGCSDHRGGFLGAGMAKVKVPHLPLYSQIPCRLIG